MLLLLLSALGLQQVTGYVSMTDKWVDRGKPDEYIPYTVPDCPINNADVIHRCLKNIKLDKASVTNYCTGQPSKTVPYITKESASRELIDLYDKDHPKKLMWGESRAYNRVRRPAGQSYGYLAFDRMCFEHESPTFKVSSVDKQVSIAGVDKVDLFKAYLEVPLWIKGTNPHHRDSTFLQAHRASIGAVQPGGFLMEPGSAIYVRGRARNEIWSDDSGPPMPEANEKDYNAVLTTKNTLRIGAGSKIIVYGTNALLEFDEVPGTYLKPNVTICVIMPFPEFVPRVHEGEGAVQGPSGQFKGNLVVTLKNNATADMLSNYVYVFHAYTEAYDSSGERDNDDYRVKPPSFTAPFVVTGPKNHGYYDFGGIEPLKWRPGDSYMFHSVLAMGRYNYELGPFHYIEKTGMETNKYPYFNYDECLQFSKHIDETLEKSRKDDSCIHEGPGSQQGENP